MNYVRKTPLLTSEERGAINRAAGRHNSEAAWPADRVAELTALVADGVSFAEIGRRMGITKNAAIGKARRLGLTTPNEPFNPKPVTTPERLDALGQFPDAGRCVYPIGHPREASFRFCASEVAVVGAPYCQFHMRLTHTRAAVEQQAA